LGAPVRCESLRSSLGWSGFLIAEALLSLSHRFVAEYVPCNLPSKGALRG